MAQLTVRDGICRAGRSLFERRYTHGTTGNISVKVGGGWLFTPTNASLGDLDPHRLAHVDANSALLSGDPPTKEAVLHMRIYEARPDAGAIVHLHSTHSVAVSCLCSRPADDVLPPLTAYYVMRVGRLPLVPFHLPGTEALADAVGEMALTSKSLLLAHHGPIVAGATLAEAMSAIEELEETPRLYLMLEGLDHQALSPEQGAAIREAFPS